MKRREFTALALGAGIGIPLAAAELERTAGRSRPRLPDRPLAIPSDGIIRTAVAIGPGTNVIDLAGPWEVFQDAAMAGDAARFELFTVAQETGTVEASGGLRLEPMYSYETAPQPQVVVVPAHQSSGRTLEWLREVAPQRRSRHVSLYRRLRRRGSRTARRDVGDHAPRLVRRLRGLLSAIRVVRGRRFVEHEHIATAGGLTSGIDLALRVVERYLGRDATDVTAAYMEYERRPVTIA